MEKSHKPAHQTVTTKRDTETDKQTDRDRHKEPLTDKNLEKTLMAWVW